MRNIFIFLLLGANVLARGSKGGSGSGSKGKDTKNEDKDQSKPADPISTPSPASSLPADISGASTLAPTMDSAITTTSSPTNTAAQETRSVSPEMQRLFGVNNRPNLTHVFDTAQRATEFLPTAGEMATADGNTPEKPTAYNLLAAVATCLVALAKCHAEGEWIESIFDIPADQTNLTTRDDSDTAKVVLLQHIDTRWTMDVQRSELDNAQPRGKQISQIDDPWWPWALYEAVNRTGSVDHDALRNKTTAHTELAGILRTLTGKQTTAISGDEIKPDELKTLIFSDIDVSPILFHRNDTTGWMVAITHTVVDGVDKLGWASAFPHVAEQSGDSGWKVDEPKGTLFDDYSEIGPKIDGVVYLEDRSRFTERPDILKSGSSRK